MCSSDLDGYVLSGGKTWISNGGIADFYVVFARTGEAPGARGITAFIVDANTTGLSIDERIDVVAPHPLATLKFTRKMIARDVEKVLKSAIANAQQKPGFGGDVDRLFVAKCWADQGPSMKRIRPAPMGRAFRVVKRTAHLTVAVAERPAKAVAAAPKAKGKAEGKTE